MNRFSFLDATSGHVGLHARITRTLGATLDAGFDAGIARCSMQTHERVISFILLS